MVKIAGLIRTVLHPKGALKQSSNLYYASVDCIGSCENTITAVFESEKWALRCGPGQIGNLFASYGWTFSPNLCPTCRVKKIAAANDVLLRGLVFLSYPNDEFRVWFIRLAESLSRDDRGDVEAVILAETAAAGLMGEIDKLLGDGKGEAENGAA